MAICIDTRPCVKIRYAVIALFSLVTYASGYPEGPLVGAAPVHIADAAAASRVSNVANLITITNKSNASIRLYPLQFGRPFIKETIPHAPGVLLDGNPIPTQADVKNRYPDGSVEFAVIAVVIPDLRPGADRVLTFRDTTANSNTPLTTAQMLDPSYDFGAAMTLAGGTPASGGKIEATSPINVTPNNWPAVPITNGGFTISVNGTPTVITGINLVGASDVNAAMQASIAAVIPGAVFEGAAGGKGLAAIQAPTGVSLSYTTRPPSGQDMGAAYNLTQAARAALTPPVAASPVTATASARTMLANGDYKLWTSGPVAQTILLGDDGPAGKYDIGFGPNGSAGGFKPFRPKFEATFWPATHQVFVRAIGENDKTTELEDLAYKLSISAGAASPVVVYTADLSGNQRPNCAAGTIPCAPKTDTAMSIWTERFWLGGTPQAQVNVNYNLAYLESTRFVANYNASLDPSGAIALEYAELLDGRAARSLRR